MNNTTATINDFKNDKIAKYLALRIFEYQFNNMNGLPYEIAITSEKTTKDAIDWWVKELKLEV